MLTSPVWLAPHVPTLLVDAHRGHYTPMLDAYIDAAEYIAADQPRAALVVSARWESSGPFMVDPGRQHRTLTEYSGFGVEIRYDCDGSPELARAVVDAGARSGLRVVASNRGVDSGVTVPMSFLVPRRGIPVVPVSVADRPHAECRAFGAMLRSVVENAPDPILFVVGGLISFDQHSWKLGREVPAQRTFDERVLAALRDGRWEDIDAERVAPARAGGRGEGEPVVVEGELRHLEILRGFVGPDARGDVRCYEPTPGVGAALVAFDVMEPGTV